MRHPVVSTLTAAFLLGAPPLQGLAFAQQVSPMGIDVSSFGDRFMTRLDISNPYAATRDFQIIAYDERGHALELWTDDAEFSLRPGGLRKVMISAPFDGRQERQILVCAETVVDQEIGTNIRAQVCSKVKGKKR